MKNRLIDSNARIRGIKNAWCSDCDNYGGVKCRACWVDDAIGLIDDAPTVDAVEVVHAYWISEGMGAWSCSSCLDIFTFDNYGDVHPKDDCGCNYCPNCGAKMDGGNEDG